MPRMANPLFGIKIRQTFKLNGALKEDQDGINIQLEMIRVRLRLTLLLLVCLQVALSCHWKSGWEQGTVRMSSLRTVLQA